MFIAKTMLWLTNKFVRLQSNCKLTMNDSFHHLNNNGGEAYWREDVYHPFYELEQC